MLVCNQEVEFLVDSGATHSVLRSDSLSPQPVLGEKFTHSVSASGTIQRENFTIPLCCVDGQGRKFTHQFLWSVLCPVNLLARDLMCKLKISLISCYNGITITQSDYDYMMVKYNPVTPAFAYGWKLEEGPLVTEFIQATRNCMPPDVCFMAPGELSCTSHFSLHGPDDSYEEGWCRTENDLLTVTCMFWSSTFAALAISLTDEQRNMFTMDASVPHVPLAKAHSCQWEDMGEFMHRCYRACDWEPTEDPTVLFSREMKAYRKTVTYTVHCVRSVELANIAVSHCLLQTTPPLNSSHPLLTEVPDGLWASSKYDVGLIKDCEPVVITPKSSFRPCQRQYPLKQEAIEGITPVFASLLKAGVIIPCPTSPVRTPLFPVKKIRGPNEPVERRFVQDLQAVNKAVIPRPPVVPNPHTILSQIPSDAMWFTVADLTNAFFSVPVHPDSQFWFAFEFQGKAYTFTRLCQGYCESPTIYNAALRDSLSDLLLSQGTVLLQYVDDLLLCAPTQEQCLTDSLTLLTHLHHKGHKASKSKLQFCKEQVTFLGHVISYNSHQISSKRVEAVMTIPKPLTKKQMMSFLGTTSYCHNFIPHYSSVEAPLTALIHGTSLSANDRISWTPEAEAAFISLKKLLQTAPVLALPDPSKPYTQMVDEKNGFMSSVLLQQHGDSLRSVGYYSSKLDPVAAGLPGCLRAVAACEKAVLASRDIVGYSPLTVQVPHAVSLILLEQKTSHLSAARWLRYSSILLDMPNITVKRCTTLNPATLLPTPEDGEPHSCTAVLGETCTPRLDLLDVPIENSDIVLYVDGSSSRDSRGTNRVGFAVCSDHATLVSGSLPRHLAQTAELVALTEACKLAESQSATIYTDSRYAFGVVHDFGALWRHRKFLKSDGKPILNANQVAALLDAILLPARIAVVKCAAHTGKTDSVSQGNAAADAAAKAAAKAAAEGGLPFQLVLAPLSTPNLADLPAVQSFASQPEKTLWRKHGCTLVESVWRSPDGRPCLPKHFFPWFLKWTHGLDHASKGGMLQAVTSLWFTKGFSTAAERYCKRCLICATNNVGRPVQVNTTARPPPDMPFDHLMMDFIELTPAEGKKYCLVVVDMFSKWVEAFPTKSADSSAVAKALLSEIIPRWGIPEKITSDNGTHFVNQALEISKQLGFKLQTHCAYHPQSGGAVERMNGS
ncbi:mannosyl-glycoprotein endo-beta-N-acetylglucosaminidase [Sarotherodon galilaeus]